MGALRIDDFSGGRNTRDAVNLVGKNESPDQNNCWTENGALVKRRGFSAVTSSFDNGAGTDITFFPEQTFVTNLGAGGTHMLCIIGRITAFATAIRALITTVNGTTFLPAGLKTGTSAVTSATVTGSGTTWNTAGDGKVLAGDLYRVDSDGEFRQILTVDSDTQLTLTAAYPSNYGAGQAHTIMKRLAVGSPVAMSALNSKLYISDGTRPVQRYDGTDVRDVVGFPLTKHMRTYKNHIFTWGHSGARSTLSWSDVNDAETWPAANNQQISPNDSDGSRGIFVYRGSLILFKNRSMYIFTGDSPFDPVNPTYTIVPLKVPDDFSFYASRAIVTHLGVMKFLTEKGWYGYRGGTELEQIISDIVSADTDAFRRLGPAEEAMQDSPVAFVHNDDMYCCVVDTGQSPSSTCNTIFVLDRDGAWWRWYPSGANGFSDFAAVQFSGGSRALIVGDVGNAELRTADTGSIDDAAAISGYWISREFTYEVEQEFLYAKIWLKKQSAGSLTVSYSLDRATFVDFTVSMTAGVGTVVEATIPIQAMGKAIRLKVLNATASQTFEVYRMAVVSNDTDGDRE